MIALLSLLLALGVILTAAGAGALDQLLVALIVYVAVLGGRRWRN